MSMMPEGCFVPDFGSLIERPRLMTALSKFGKRALLIAGPSGSGKTVAAAQHAVSSGNPVIWIDAAGLACSALQVVGEILCALADGSDDEAQSDSVVDDADVAFARLAQKLAPTGPLCVVVDDLGLPASPAEWRSLSRILHRLGSQLVITCRQIDEWEPEFAAEMAILDHSGLALSSSEARRLLAHGEFEAISSRCDEIWSECAGHVAFFSVLALHVRDHGFDYLSERSVSLDVWIGRAVSSQLSHEERHVLGLATLLKQGTDADLQQLEVNAGIAVLQAASRHIPLVVLRRRGSARWEFRIHDLVDGYYLDHDLYRSVDRDEWRRSISLLTERGDLVRAAELLSRQGDSEMATRWLLSWGESLLSTGQLVPLAQLIDAMSVGALMGYPRLLLLWSELSAEMGHIEEALARSKASRSLAQSEGDRVTACRAAGHVLTCLRRMNRVSEADLLAAEIIEVGSPVYDELLIADALLCIGHNRILAGDWIGAGPVLRQAETLAITCPEGSRAAQTIRHTRGLIPALGYGDYVASSRELAPLIEAAAQPLSFRVTVRGNVAIFLVESGRLHRGESLIRAVLADTATHGLALYEGSYQPVLGCVLCAKGEVEQGLKLVRDGVAKSIAAADESAADQARVYLAVILRAAGQLDESLTEAERAFERLSVTDSMHFRRLAALEVAASLLALGDSGAARAWTESIAMEGFSGNLYHALRADLILAELDRIDGRPSEAIARLAEHREYILSENPNWQIAMYCRAFPALLALVSAAVAPKPVPSHLLRMILPEHAEDCLGAARSVLGESEWRGLGERLLGEVEFAAYLQRDGLPLCHVRLFGGLELSIGGRAVRERDWKKRKARLLFAMLAIRRGQDVPRDQLFEYLWPEMDAERAKNNLYVVWSTMKAALVGDADRGAPCPYIESAGGVCRTVRDAVRTDVDEFEQSLIAAREAEVADQPGTALRAYERIADVYRGDLLPGDVYDDWFATLRDHYRSSFVDAMLRATALLMRADDPGNALIYARRAIQCDPYREDLFQAVLRCQISAGQRSSAIDTYFQCRDNLAEELGLDPSVETRALYDQILAMEDRPRLTPMDPLM